MNTLELIFDWMLQASLRASALTVSVLLLQRLLRQHLSARWLYALWLPVLIVLLMPALVESRWSVEHIFSAPTQPVQITPVPSDLSTSSLPLDINPPPAAPMPIAWSRILLITWLVGAAGVFLLGSLSFIITLHRFKRSCQPVSEELSATLAQIAREVCLRHVPRVWIAPTIRSPAVTCLLRPTLLLPMHLDHAFTPVEIRLILKHELMHLKRHDLSLNALLCLLMALHWFNPLLWLAFFKVRFDREAACDAQVLQNDTNDRRREYGHALLKVETAFCPRGLSLGFVGIFQRGNALRSRIQSIANPSQPHHIMKSIITLCMVLLTFFGITKAQQPADAPGSTFSIGQSAFRQGDSIRISQVQRGADFMTVTADYELASDDTARISLFITSMDKGKTKVEASQTKTIAKGKGSVVLHHPQMYEGLPHVSFYSTEDGKAFGGIYFGTSEEAQASRELRLGYPRAMKSEASAPKSPIQAKLDAIIFPKVQFSEATLEEALAFLRAKSRLLDASEPNEAKRGVNFILQGAPASTALISMDLKNVPLSQVVKYTADLADLEYRIEENAVVFLSRSKDAAVKPATPIQGKAVELAKKHILPQVHFSGATLEEAVEFLRANHRDREEAPTPWINFILKPGGNPKTQITLDLKDVSLWEAVRYIAELSNHTLSADDHSIILTPTK